MTDIDHALEAHRREKEVSPSSDEELPRFREEEEFRLAPVETAENLEVASVLPTLLRVLNRSRRLRKFMLIHRLKSLVSCS